jgi:hypothetical protein
MRPLLAAACLVLLALGCNSPTDPTDVDLTGRWNGNLGNRHPANEDWTSVTIDLTETGNDLTGELRERNGHVHPLKGTRIGSIATLDVTDIPSLGDPACSSLTLSFSRIETSSVRGALSGRCYGTVLTQFVLTR